MTEHSTNPPDASSDRDASLAKYVPDYATPDVVAATRQISQAFTKRGNAYMADGRYDLAVGDYGQALNHRFENVTGDVYNPEASANRGKALVYLYWFVRSKVDPAKADSEMQEWAREAVRKASIPQGYLVVAAEESILAIHPLTDQGHQEAIKYANDLASDPDARFIMDDHYMTETDEFDTSVYRYDGLQMTEVHRALALDEAGEQLHKMYK